MKYIDNIEILNQYLENCGILKKVPHITRYHPRLYDFERNETILPYESEIESIFILTSGKLSVSIPSAEGKTLLHIFCEPGEVLGELELFSKTLCISDVCAVSRSTCAIINLSQYKKEILNDQKMLQLFCENLSHKLEATANNSAQNLLVPLECRLASRILRIEKNSVYQDNQSVLAPYLGISYRHLQRCFNQFVQKGYLSRIHKGVYHIEDRSALCALSDSSEVIPHTVLKNQ